MDVFVKGFADYRTIKLASGISSSVVLDSLEAEVSTVTVAGFQIKRGDTGNWLVLDGNVFLITGVNPGAETTVVQLSSPLDAFTRDVAYIAPAAGSTIGGFVKDQMIEHWRDCQDAVYAIPYLDVSNLDTSAFVPPDMKGITYSLADYCRMVRRSSNISVVFRDNGKSLACEISQKPSARRNVDFSDGRSIMVSVNYASSGVAKITAIVEKTDGNTTASEWYLSASGEVLQDIPAHRAKGSWEMLTLKEGDDVASKVLVEFSKNQRSDKIEFFSSLDLSVQDVCEFVINGELVTSQISYKRKESNDSRYFYKAGELPVTVSEKLKGVLK